MHVNFCFNIISSSQNDTHDSLLKRPMFNVTLINSLFKKKLENNINWINWRKTVTTSVSTYYQPPGKETTNVYCYASQVPAPPPPPMYIQLAKRHTRFADRNGQCLMSRQSIPFEDAENNLNWTNSQKNIENRCFGVLRKISINTMTRKVGSTKRSMSIAMKIALNLLCVLSVALLVQGSALSSDQHWAVFKVNLSLSSFS